MSEFADSFLKPASRLVQSYNQDTNDFISKINGLKFIHEYPNIDHKEGIDPCSHV